MLNIMKADTEKLNFNTLFTKDISHAIFLYLDICTRPLTVVFLFLVRTTPKKRVKNTRGQSDGSKADI